MMERGLSSIGLDVGSRWIKAAQLKLTRTGYKLHACARLERRSSEGEAYLADEECDRLKSMFWRQGFSGRDVVCVVPHCRLIKQVMDLPSISSGAPIDQIARAELARLAKCPINQMETVWWELPRSTRGSGVTGPGAQVMGIACTHGAAEWMISPLESAGMRVEALDTPTTALARATSAILGGSNWSDGERSGGEVGVIVDLGWNEGAIAIYSGSRLVYERVLTTLGVGPVVRQLTTKLAINDEMAGYLIEHVGINHAAGMLAGGVPAQPMDSEAVPIQDEDPELIEDARQVVVNHVEQTLEEVQTSVAYAMRRFGSKVGYGDSASSGVGPVLKDRVRVLVVGGGSKVPGLMEQFARVFGEDLMMLTPQSCVEMSGREPHADDPSMTLAVGLAMHHGSAAGAGGGS